MNEMNKAPSAESNKKMDKKTKEAFALVAEFMKQHENAVEQKAAAEIAATIQANTNKIRGKTNKKIGSVLNF
ncbi:hypothetical protein COB57_01145 [Candidatus Peregrinibacteria bacterium]|nr:MAG: hypothetical protein COB57_01145 [Candidatus Peregrinibacteria bacterium]